MNGYINVDLGGKKRGIKFGNRALLDVMAKHQISEGVKFSFDLIVDLIFAGLVNNCMIAKHNVDFTIEEVTEWVDDMPMTSLMDIFTVFQKSYEGAPTETAAPGKALPKPTKSKAGKK